MSVPVFNWNILVAGVTSYNIKSIREILWGDNVHPNHHVALTAVALRLWLSVSTLISVHTALPYRLLAVPRLTVVSTLPETRLLPIPRHRLLSIPLHRLSIPRHFLPLFRLRLSILVFPTRFPLISHLHHFISISIIIISNLRLRFTAA